MICLVYAIFYLVGWEMGAVEAVSLSILVGSSVDYCVHLVEGYLLAGRNPPAHIANVSLIYVYICWESVCAHSKCKFDLRTRLLGISLHT